LEESAGKEDPEQNKYLFFVLLCVCAAQISSYGVNSRNESESESVASHWLAWQLICNLLVEEGQKKEYSCVLFFEKAL
jgi:hypothetical protein